MNYTVRLGLALLAAGVAFQAWAFLVNAWPTVFYLWLMALGGVIALVGWIGRHWRFTGWVGFGIFASFWLVLWLFVGVDREWPREMIAEPAADGSVTLRLASDPNRRVTINRPDRELQRYLDSLPDKKVRVVFRVSTTFGRVYAHSGLVINGRSYWYSGETPE